MEADDSELRTSIRYEPDDRPPILLAFGLGLELAILSVAGIVLTTAIVVRAGGGPKPFSPGPCLPRSVSAACPR